MSFMCESENYISGAFVMRILTIAVLGWFSGFLSIQALAASSCSYDALGNYNCRSTDGTSTSSNTDVLGTTTTRSNTGQTWRSNTDVLGTTRLR